MKRSHTVFFSLLLALLQLCVVSCGKGADTGNPPESIQSTGPVDTEPATTEPEKTLWDDLPGENYNGAKFSMLSEEASTWAIVQMTAEELNGEIINDTLFNIDRLVEDRLNVAISSVLLKSANAVRDTARAAVAAGQDEYSVYQNTLDVTAPLILEGAFRELRELPNLNLDKPWWDENLRKSLTFNNKSYTLIGDCSVMVYESHYCIHINTTLAKDLKIDRYQTVRDGKWTLDQLYSDTKLAYADLNGNGTVEYGDRIGICSNLRAMSYFMIAGGEMIYTENNGLPEFTGLSEKALGMYTNILQKLFINESTSIAGGTFPAGKNWKSAFWEGNALYMFEPLGAIREFGECTFDYGVLPLPKYDDAQKEYIVPILQFVHSNFVTKVAAAPDMISAVLENLSAESYKDLRPAYFEVVLSGKRAQDKETLNMLNFIFTNKRVLNQACVFDWGKLSSQLNTNARDKNENIASVIASILPKVQSDIQKTIEFYGK